MLIIGLTGSMGTGKTTVAKMLAKLGAHVIDADKIAHSVLLPGSKQHKRIVSCFGTAERRKLGQIVFKDNDLLKKLNEIIHPEVVVKIKANIKKIKIEAKAKIVVIDAPLLIEVGLDKVADKLIVVKLDRDIQLKRIVKKTGLSKQGALSRINAQMPLAKKLKLADFIIDNSATKRETRKQAKFIWEKLKG